MQQRAGFVPVALGGALGAAAQRGDLGESETGEELQVDQFGPGESLHGTFHVNGSGDAMSGGALLMLSGYYVNVP